MGNTESKLSEKMVASGNSVTVCYGIDGHRKFVALAIQHADVPVRYVNVYQRVTFRTLSVTFCY